MMIAPRSCCEGGRTRLGRRAGWSPMGVAAVGGLVGLFFLLAARPGWAADPQRRTENVILVTLDGLRWQEVFHGAEQRLLRGEDATVRDVAGATARFWNDDATQRREQLLPFLWKTVAVQGQLFGDPERHCAVRVTNGRNFSYPGYNEILTGFADDRIDSNAKRPNPNVTVLEWLMHDAEFQDRVAASCSWDVFPYILNVNRSKMFVSAPWDPVVPSGDAARDALLREAEQETPRVWAGVRFDFYTYCSALHLLRTRQPRVLYVALGETDDWAHEGRYDLYLDAAHRDDRYIEQLWNAAQALPRYAGKTSLVITTDHGRGEARDGWKSHGAHIPEAGHIWIAVLGPDTPALGIRQDEQVTQSQVAATVAYLLGRDYTAFQPKAAPPLPGVVAGR